MVQLVVVLKLNLVLDLVDQDLGQEDPHQLTRKRNNKKVFRSRVATETCVCVCV